jgi:hypothetical protein
LYSTAKLRCTFFNIKSLEESTGWFGDMLGHSQYRLPDYQSIVTSDAAAQFRNGVADRTRLRS